MKISSFLPAHVALSLALTAHSQAQSSVSFGWLYGWDHDISPTTVQDGGTSALGNTLEGTNLWFLCMDKTGTDPTNEGTGTWTYSLSTSSSILAGGIWNRIPVGSARDTVIGGISNMFFNNEALIFADNDSNGSYNTPGSAMQFAAWAMIEGYGTVWSGTLNQTAINAIVASDPKIPGTLTRTFLNSSLVANPNKANRVFFGEPAGSTSSSFQGAMFFTQAPIPEPTGILLGGLSCVLLVPRRRR